MASEYDLVIIGGGIQGAGVAQAAAASGYQTLVLEQYPSLAQGSSSRSSKLIHGGLRYLETRQFSLVRESLRERALLLKLAPNLVRLMPFHIPVYQPMNRGPLKIRAGLSLYAALGGMLEENRFEKLPRREWRNLDGLNEKKLKAVFRYRDAQTDDAALTRAIMASAQSMGAELLLSTPLEKARCHHGQWILSIREGDQPRELRCKALVNAAGPWVNRVLEKIKPAHEVLKVELVQGSHLVLPGQLEKGSYYVEAEDGRAIFTIPWRGNILLGTTETPWNTDPAATFPLDAELDYLLESHARFFPSKTCSRKDVVASFAGLRVLPHDAKRPFARSRDAILKTLAPVNLLSIYGGKLTTYRATAESVMKMLAPGLPDRSPLADTRTLKLEPVD
ncbi:MAG: glycerol-3-phosphate dehydrogenase/oxidase [Candidatus Krumholzibacteria bacterium]|nr:glycerol-3-phosphate dehydrogenase/oxidase [Candidatus Krumholzibacteria bacterium]MDP6668375.1 glycerol-3-phosphate dehydrogenase/oxidase [Candidatus Krumholzibacteria bacterium]MDP6797423.1 glycerol-3-phosphate dehydrogenase/oxidase [Candidatus Krumholzibacteria bacterium]MDP7022172.1 glycerol-3-phosphate dehydrogenase/oxidase [Candidatus Krumholzibacteria bacterium]